MTIERIVWITVVIVLVLAVCRLFVVLKKLAHTVRLLSEVTDEYAKAIALLSAHPDPRRGIEH